MRPRRGWGWSDVAQYVVAFAATLALAAAFIVVTAGPLGSARGPAGHAGPSSPSAGTPGPTAASAVDSGSPSASPAKAPSPPAVNRTPRPTATPQPEPPVRLEPGSLAVTIVDEVRVRSKPGTTPDSIRYEPLLPQGTEMSITGAPVAASGYWWYPVELRPDVLNDGVRDGWIAAGARDGTPWIAAMGIDGG